ncbi:uncharacterized protein N7529_009220 [Penicillium soppii]|uniref:uncharacterized protein n=1 Tax=Penicillium soppii TaxID=69789 RepID=UPI00254766E4|nr:uncharacterized protein N7529_009220 [Penicillium soppii]KAJ5861910.1 hypothetical protein N7529_009220 [Penicillium soppii]
MVLLKPSTLSISHLKWDEFRCSIIDQDAAVFMMRSEPSIKLSPLAAAVLLRSKAIRRSEIELVKRQVYDIEPAEEPVPLIESGSALVGVKSVSKSLIKAIVKPTVSHISDAYNSREVSTQQRTQENGTSARESGKFKSSKSDVAVKVAKIMGFGSAVFCGKVAALPFKTVWYMGETASYGIRSLQGLERHQGRVLKAIEEAETKYPQGSIRGYLANNMETTGC